MGAAKKGTEMAGTGIIWTLLGIGLAACAGGTSYVAVDGKPGPDDRSLSPSDQKTLDAALQAETGTVFYVGDEIGRAHVRTPVTS